MSTTHIRNNTLHVDNFMNPIFASVNIIVIANSNMHIEFCYTISLYSNIFHLGHKTHVSKETFSKKYWKQKCSLCTLTVILFYNGLFLKKIVFVMRCVWFFGFFGCYENWNWKLIFQIFRDKKTQWNLKRLSIKHKRSFWYS